MTTKLLDIGTYGLHVIQFPSGRYGFVGSIPVSLVDESTGRCPSFETEQEAIDYARNRIS